MPNLTPIKIKIVRGTTQGMVYPDFNTLDPSVRDNMNWSRFFDKKGIGWCYDQVDNMCSTGNEFEFGVALVPPAFAAAAIASFPTLVSAMNEAAFQTFYNTKSRVAEPDMHYDNETLQAMSAAESLGHTISAGQKNKSLDPDDLTPGIIRNRKKTWALVKGDRSITIVPPA